MARKCAIMYLSNEGVEKPLKDLILMVDTETANTNSKNMLDALVYDCGFAVIDRQGVIYDELSIVNREIFFDAGQSATAGLFSAKYRAIIFYVGFTDRHGAGLTPFQLGIKPKGGESHAEPSACDIRHLHRRIRAS